MKLPKKIINYLKKLEDGPDFIRNFQEVEWVYELWKVGYIDIFGESVYITDAGRVALDASKGER